MKYKTSELTGALLDAAVAKLEGYDQQHGRIIATLVFNHSTEICDNRPAYSTDWCQGGPIIEREGIRIDPPRSIAWWSAEKNGHMHHGSTPLIAAMRTYVAHKLGDEVDL